MSLGLMKQVTFMVNKNRSKTRKGKKNQTTLSGGAEKRQGRGGDLEEEEEEGWRLKSKHT